MNHETILQLQTRQKNRRGFIITIKETWLVNGLIELNIVQHFSLGQSSNHVISRMVFTTKSEILKIEEVKQA